MKNTFLKYDDQLRSGSPESRDTGLRTPDATVLASA
jgi:hypothetical protein